MTTGNDNKTEAFPWDIPLSRPDRELSKAMARLYENYPTPRPEDNPLFTSFKYTRITGFDYGAEDGRISRRDPSKIICENGTFYIWYTKRDTVSAPRGAAECTDEIPSMDWDLSDIWYATSEDGFHWQEQGLAVARAEKPKLGWRAVCTPDILVWKGKYYLYYQAFDEPSGLKGDHCPVSVSVADSPDGPWTPCGDSVIPNGAPGEWDQYSIHGPYPIVINEKIYIYYKAAFGDRPDYLVGNGVAIADDPLGPFVKHPLNPVLNSGHETTVFRFGKGVAAFAIRNGIESNTIQYSTDGINFDIAAVTALMPVGAGPYIADVFTSKGEGQGFTWGLSHFCDHDKPDTKFSFLGRFDCDLRNKMPRSKVANNTEVKWHPDVCFSQGLTDDVRAEREQEAREIAAASLNIVLKA
ncbi:glycoside hydrolase family 117 protein [Gilvimarinus polysaccharolyticus]|uniref:glycoside hydrolase family 117 protein n=1 Tax=Gilvimarinus polysaccharolyticus TaxID=863921 RepID=UPI0006739330|nr:family 43 glycosylhydrolase [Gilvimarinus polysaccharolyticus]